MCLHAHRRLRSGRTQASATETGGPNSHIGHDGREVDRVPPPGVSAHSYNRPPNNAPSNRCRGGMPCAYQHSGEVRSV
jgi:hypothetical protein